MKTFRFVLPSLAVVSILAFSTPAVAGMVATPRAAAQGERDAALQLLRARMAEAGPDVEAYAPGLDSLTTPELLALSGTIESGLAAGHHRAFWLTVGIFALIFFLAFDHHRFHHCWCD